MDGPVESLSAVTLHTADMRAAVAFYVDLGFEVLYGGPDAAFTSFRVGDGYLNLQPGDAPRESGGGSSSTSTTSTPCTSGSSAPATSR